MIFDNEIPADDHADLFLKAVDLYGEITGVAVPKHEGDRPSNWRIGDNYGNLRDALILDPSTLTANLMLAYYAKDFLSNQTLSLMSLMQDPDAYLAKVVKPKALFDIVNRDDVVEARDGFIGRLRTALNRYGAAGREDVEKVLNSPDHIAFLRRDALKGVQRMQMHQFTDGAPEPADVRPVYHTNIFQWWNINSLLAAAVNMPSGVSLNLIRDRDEYQSYFCFCIRNGGRLLILTDAPEYAHPLQGSMTRRPDRALGSRSVQAWFPYDLLGLRWDEENEEFYIEKSDETGLAVYQQEHKVLKPMAEIGASELIWATMMLDQIVDRFWTKGETAPELSYTGEMLKTADRLISAAAGSLTTVSDYTPLALAPLTHADMQADALNPAHIGKTGSGLHGWMEKRYGAKVDAAVFNTVAQGGMLLLAEDAPLINNWHKDRVIEGRPMDGGMRAFTPSEVEYAGMGHRSHNAKKGLVFFDSTKFGTREQIEADRVWLARHNYATEIKRMAEAEFEARKDEIKTWVAERYKAKLDNLIAYAGNQELWIETGLQGAFESDGGGGGMRSSIHLGTDADGKSIKRTFRPFMSLTDLAEERRTKDYDYSTFGSIDLSQGYDRGKGAYLCALTGAAASYRIKFTPTTAAQLAFLCGVEVHDLPDVLQHWSLGRPYAGNHILDRIDPMVWALSNPWSELSLRPMLYLSKRGLAKAKTLARTPTLAGIVDPAELTDGFEAYKARLLQALGGKSA